MDGLRFEDLKDQAFLRYVGDQRGWQDAVSVLWTRLDHGFDRPRAAEASLPWRSICLSDLLADDPQDDSIRDARTLRLDAVEPRAERLDRAGDLFRAWLETEVHKTIVDQMWARGRRERISREDLERRWSDRRSILLNASGWARLRARKFPARDDQRIYISRHVPEDAAILFGEDRSVHGTFRLVSLTMSAKAKGSDPQGVPADLEATASWRYKLGEIEAYDLGGIPWES